MAQADASFQKSSTATEGLRRVAVLLPLPLVGPYDYAVPKGMPIAIGDYVEAPLGPRSVVGVVWGEGDGGVASAKLKPIVRRFDAPPMPDIHRRFIDWVAAYTLSPQGAVLRMSLTALKALEPPRPGVAFQVKSSLSGLMLTAARRRVLDVLAERGAATAQELAEAAGCGVAVVRGLADAGGIETVLLPPRYPASWFDPTIAGPTLSPDQTLAAVRLRAKLGSYSATLLDGVTGAGKTEVYFEAIAANIAHGRQSLVLLPEIALSAQSLDRFTKRFGAPPAFGIRA